MSEILSKNQITPNDLGLLLYIKLNTAPTEYVKSIIQTYVFDSLYENTEYTVVEIFEKREWIKYIKTGKKDPINRIRLADKGEDIIKSLSQKPLHEIADKCWEILKEGYQRYNMAKEKVVNKSKTTFYISEFLYEKENIGKPYTEKMFQALVYTYLSTIDYGANHFVKKTLKLLFESTNKFASKWSTEDCFLWGFSENHKPEIQTVYRKLFAQ